MTFWQESVSLSAHLAHLPSPVIVFSSAPKLGVAKASVNTPVMQDNRTRTFFIRLFWFLWDQGLWERLIRPNQKKHRSNRQFVKSWRSEAIACNSLPIICTLQTECMPGRKNA